MKAVILAGGRGVRLRPLTYSIPKPLLPVGEKPILEVILTQLRSFQFTEFILAVGYRADLIEAHFGDGTPFGVHIDYVRESEPLGTAGPLGAIGRRYQFARGESLLVMNGDILTKLDFCDLIRFHQEGDWDITIASRRYEARLPFGALILDGSRVVGIEEKPARSYDVSAGIYVVKASVLSEVPEDTFFEMPDLVDRLLVRGRPVGAYRFDDYWLSVDQAEHLEQANRDWEGGVRP